MGARLPPGIWALGTVSLLMDISSEMIHGLMPVFLVSVLGASALTVGLIEGIGEATAAVAKLFSGVASDWMGRRKPLVVLGYGLATLSKPMFALAPTAGWVLGGRFADRVGKGLRGAPRDALIADLVAPEQRGAAYGLRQSLDNVGAFVGPLLAAGLMLVFVGQFRLVFWLALIPGLAAVAVLVLFVREPDPVRPAQTRRFPIDRHAARRLGGGFWIVVSVGAILTLARFSEAFVILLAEDRGLAVALAPLVLVGIHVASSVSAYPVGILSDRMDRRTLLLLGFGVLVLADAAFVLLPGQAGLWTGIALWGLHLGATQGLLSALVAETAPTALRATAFGIFNLITGLSLLGASAIAGLLWQVIGPEATFTAGGAVAVAGLAGYRLFVPRPERRDGRDRRGPDKGSPS